MQELAASADILESCWYCQQPCENQPKFLTRALNCNGPNLKHRVQKFWDAHKAICSVKEGLTKKVPLCARDNCLHALYTNWSKQKFPAVACPPTAPPPLSAADTGHCPHAPPKKTLPPTWKLPQLDLHTKVSTLVLSI